LRDKESKHFWRLGRIQTGKEMEMNETFSIGREAESKAQVEGIERKNIENRKEPKNREPSEIPMLAFCCMNAEFQVAYIACHDFLQGE
jgi:hypothetical protein